MDFGLAWTLIRVRVSMCRYICGFVQHMLENDNAKNKEINMAWLGSFVDILPQAQPGYRFYDNQQITFLNQTISMIILLTKSRQHLRSSRISVIQHSPADVDICTLRQFQRSQLQCKSNALISVHGCHGLPLCTASLLHVRWIH